MLFFLFLLCSCYCRLVIPLLTPIIVLVIVIVLVLLADLCLNLLLHTFILIMRIHIGICNDLVADCLLLFVIFSCLAIFSFLRLYYYLF